MMHTPKAILLVLFSIFVAGNIVTEWRNRKALPWQSNPLSAYLAGVPWAWVQDVGFLALTAAFFILGINLTIPDSLFIVSGLSIIGVVATQYFVFPILSQTLKFHVVFAAIAYTAATAALLMETLHLGGLAFGAALAVPCVAFLFMRFAPSQTSLEEKAVTACLMVSLYAWVLG